MRDLWAILCVVAHDLGHVLWFLIKLAVALALSLGFVFVLVVYPITGIVLAWVSGVLAAIALILLFLVWVSSVLARAPRSKSK